MKRGRPGGLGAERAYRFLLQAYSRQYRVRFGKSMLDTLLLDFDRVRSKGLAALVIFWMVTALQATAFGLRERAGRLLRLTHKGPPAAILAGRGSRGSIMTDASYALRKLIRSPLFAGTSIVSLSIGLAAATTLFGLADALFLKPIPGIRDADAVVEIERTTFGEDYDTLSYPIFEHLRDYSQTLEQIAATIRDPILVSLKDGVFVSGCEEALDIGFWPALF